MRLIYLQSRISRTLIPAQILTLLFLSAQGRAQGKLEWRPMPKPDGAARYAIAADGDRLCAGTKYFRIFDGTPGKIFCSTDVGAAWTPLLVGELRYYPEKLEVDGERVFAGTMEGLFVAGEVSPTLKLVAQGGNLQNSGPGEFTVAKGVILHRGSGTRISRDGGATWLAVGPPLATTEHFEFIGELGGYFFPETPKEFGEPPIRETVGSAPLQEPTLTNPVRSLSAMIHACFLSTTKASSGPSIPAQLGCK